MADKQIEIEVVTRADFKDLDDLSSKLEEAQNQAKDLDIEPEVNTADVETLTRELEEATAEVENLTNELAGIEMGEIDGDFDEVASQLEDASARVEELQSALDGLDGSNAGAVADEVSSIGDGADEADTAVQGLGDSLTLLDASALMSISSEIGNLGSQAEGMAQDMNTASISVGQLATNAGVAEPQMVGLINNISNATFPQNEAIAYVGVLNQMGVSADKLGDSATNMDKINDATGMGYNNVMLLTQGLQSMGISADNLPSSFNALAYAEANIGGGAQTLQQVLKRQAGTLNEYGMDVDSTVVALSTLQRQTGLTGMKLGTEFSSRLKDCNGDLGALEQSLGLQAGALSNASQYTDEYSGQLQALADEEGEHKSILDQLNAAWEDISLSMSPVLAPMASFMGLIGQVGSWAVGINGLIQLGNHVRGLSVVETASGWVSSLGTKISGLASTARGAITSIASFATTIGTTVYNAVVNAATALYELALNVLTTGYNALKSAAMWAVEKTAMIASTIAEYAAAAAQWALNIAMDANPIMLIVVAIGLLVAALGYLYFNNEQVKAAVDGLGQSLYNIGTIIYSYLVQAFNFIVSTLEGVWNYIITLGGMLPANVDITGNQIIDTVLRVLAFIATLPFQITMYFANMIASSLGFGNNFSQNMITGATNAVNGFVSWITSLPGRLQEELDKMLQMASQFALDIANALTGGAAGMVLGWITGSGESSPGYMYDAFIGELQAMVNAPTSYLADLATNVATGAYNMVNGAITAFSGLTLDEIYNEIVTDIQSIISWFQWMYDNTLTLGGLLPEPIQLTGNNIVDTILQVILFIGTLPMQIEMYLIDIIAKALGFGDNFTQSMLTAGSGGVNSFLSYIMNLPANLAGYLNTAIGRVTSFAGSFVQSISSAASRAVSGFMSYISTLPGRFNGELQKMLGYAKDFLVNLPATLKNAAINVVKGWIFGTGERSPGYMYDAFEGELSAMENVATSNNIPRNMGRIANQLVDEFGEPELRLNVGEAFSNSSLNKLLSGELESARQNITFNFSDIVVDNEERMERIVEYVTRSIAFDNKTAGRTV